MTQQMHSWAFIPEIGKCTFTQKAIHEYSKQLSRSNPKLEITQMSLNGCMVKQTVVHASYGTLLGNKKGRTHYISWMDFKRIILSEKSYSQKRICCVISFI